MVSGSSVHVSVKAVCIVIEAQAEPTLEQMLAQFDKQRYGGEAMADAPRVAQAFEDRTGVLLGFP